MNLHIRPAVAADAPLLAELVTESSGGTFVAIWRALAGVEDSILDAGVRYLLDDRNDLNVRNAFVVAEDERPLGGLICYPELDTKSHDEPIPSPLAKLPDLEYALSPYAELRCPDSLFIAEVAVVPEARGKGAGTLLFDHAIKIARREGLRRLSLKVFSENRDAVRLYEKLDFIIADKRRVIPHPDIRYDGDVYLMTRSQ